ncbi:alpha/beta fold hydrolase [Mesobacterium sp. TK19101]|uniref:Alpha/beta fold hydrolase n=1 Tax=Mesobacterium hydrothermale TaxID=3111907 RepID=A0ABU6HII3_9RHOB|nr:alpha/beta fold hydrolase [Mesobacterium sp. TK19101]MEC3862141.1 alpha/beta fold hydrolase [Mesobacterium sp. TK19101]
MRAVLTWIGRGLIILLAGIAAMWAFAPREPVDLNARFDDGLLSGGVDTYLAGREARFADIRPGQEKQMIWANAPGMKTPISLVYIHGFSASSAEIRPVPDRLAAKLGANLFFTRLAGHGRTGDAMAGPTVNDWMQDVAEALAIGRATGDRVIVLSTSTGATLSALAAANPEMMQRVAGVAMISPNFKVKNPAAQILTWPGVRWWGPLVAGKTRGFEARTPEQLQSWTTSYPTVALLPMAQSVRAARQMDPAGATVPALFLFDPEDPVVDHTETLAVAANWGGPVTLLQVRVGDADDRHVIAGDILSPGQTDATVARLAEWVAGL